MRTMGVCIIVSALAVGCHTWRGKAVEQTEPSAVSLPSPNSEDAVLPSNPAGGGEMLAYVNGSPVFMEELQKFLLPQYGLRLSQQILTNKVVEQAAAEKDLTVTVDDIRTEHSNTLKVMFPRVEGADQRHRLWEQFLIRRDVSRPLWEMTMRRNALLDKLITDPVQVSEQDLQAEFVERYGRKVIVRHIQLASLQEAQHVMDQLQHGADFAKLAGKVSQHPSAHVEGLLPPIGAKADGIPTALHEAAWALEKPGQMTGPIQAGTVYHILRLEQVIDAQDVQLDEVRVQITEAVRLTKRRAARQQLQEILLKQADIQYVNPVLKRQAAQAAEGSTP